MYKDPKGFRRGFKGDIPGEQGIIFKSPLLKKIGLQGRTVIIK